MMVTLPHPLQKNIYFINKVDFCTSRHVHGTWCTQHFDTYAPLVHEASAFRRVGRGALEGPGTLGMGGS